MNFFPLHVLEFVELFYFFCNVFRMDQCSFWIPNVEKRLHIHRRVEGKETSNVTENKEDTVLME